jgi:DUF4097 and DUF4098 domain-containing protein YvlB
MRKTIPAAVVRVAMFAAAVTMAAACDISIGAAEFSVREEKKFAVTGPTRLALTTFDGSIDVRGWDRNEVRVEVEKRGPDQATVDRIQITSTQNGNTITLDVEKPSPLTTTGFQRSPSASLIVTVPLQTAITARSGDGSITIRRVNGKVDLDTDDGSVRVEEVRGDVAVRTADGSVHTRGVDGHTKINTGDGSIGVEGVLTGLELETRDGSIEVTARTGSVVESGWSVTTGDGSIRLEVPEGFNADLDAQSADGRVRVDKLADQAPSTGEREERDRDRSSARGKLGAGGKPLKLRSGSGSITVKNW